MKQATVSELKNQLSQFLRYVKRGEKVIVLDRGTPIADILPHKTTASSGDERLTRLEAHGILHKGDPKRIAAYSPPEKSGESTGLLETLLEERKDSR